jgi:hypothetical protein
MPKNLAWTQQQVDSMLPSPAKLRQKINNYDIHKTQSLLQIIILNLKNINKYLALPRYWRRQDIGAAKILAPTKYWWQQNIGADKIYASTKLFASSKLLASTKYWHRKHIRVNKILASMKSWRRQKVGAGAGESPYCKARQIRSF